MSEALMSRTVVLSRIRQRLLQHIARQGAEQPLGSAGVFFCRRGQALRNVPIFQPTLILVLDGTKQVHLGGGRSQYQIAGHGGDLLLWPGPGEVCIDNLPDTQRGQYLALAISFSPAALQGVVNQYGSHLQSWQQAKRWQVSASVEVLTALDQWLQQAPHLQDPLVQTHRQMELLLLLARSGAAGHLLSQPHTSWRQRLVAQLQMDLSRDWKLADICQQLAVSESTLRRHLQAESCSFREVLEEVRLVAGLSLLQETDWTVQRVAHEVGYLSQSRFSERFKRRFAVTPSGLRASREAVPVTNPQQAAQALQVW